ncbi:MarR family transcriptional regulator [Streptomyces sp. SID5785]|uniref:MarR family winged helix-turn-helix transcriptional regulator n=1 Tax=Streptomyces sp. SID5785 TaxID=2690309 RepID=UPI0013611C15|nr:MarR family transcriptional regulator [Streptomyces sp. SID5785]MZD06254.1 MarR family transcriptional regulator [Streptomyces sp. SID5785]
MPQHGTEDRSLDTLISLATSLRVQAARTVLFQAAVAQSIGLNATDFNCLSLLDLEGPMTPGRLAERAGLSRGGAITTVVDRLQKAGFVQRRPDPEDRRRVIVETVPEAFTERVETAFADFRSALGKLLAELTTEQQQLLLDVTNRSNEIFHTETLRLQAQA